MYNSPKPVSINQDFNSFVVSTFLNCSKSVNFWNTENDPGEFVTVMSIYGIYCHVPEYMRDRTALLDWIETNRKIKEIAKQNFTDTDYEFKLHNQAHPVYQNTPPKSTPVL